MLKEIQSSRKERLEHLHSLCRENQLIYQIPTWVSHEGIQRSELCLNLLGNPVKKYIPFMSQHENCSFNRCYCSAEHKTLRIKRKLKKTPGQIHCGTLKRGNRQVAMQFSLRYECKIFNLVKTWKQFALGRLWHLHSQRYSEIKLTGF